MSFDGREHEIRKLLGLRVSKASIAKITGVSPTALDNFIRSRGLTGAAPTRAYEPK